jgi:hypothetical protein
MRLLNSRDFTVGKQLTRIMEQYNKLLLQLRDNFRHLRTKRDFERSVFLNEDGFFLTLYKLICDAQSLARHHLYLLFQRQRKELVTCISGS